MGHKNIKTTMEIYTHLDKENTHKSVGSKIEDYLKKTVNNSDCLFDCLSAKKVLF